jgi:hypothetical protein
MKQKTITLIKKLKKRREMLLINVESINKAIDTINHKLFYLIVRK